MGVCSHPFNLQYKRNDIMHKWNQDDRQGDHRKRCQGDTIAENYFCIYKDEVSVPYHKQALPDGRVAYKFDIIMPIREYYLTAPAPEVPG